MISECAFLKSANEKRWRVLTLQWDQSEKSKGFLLAR